MAGLTLPATSLSSSSLLFGVHGLGSLHDGGFRVPTGSAFPLATSEGGVGLGQSGRISEDVQRIFLAARRVFSGTTAGGRSLLESVIRTRRGRSVTIRLRGLVERQAGLYQLEG